MARVGGLFDPMRDDSYINRRIVRIRMYTGLSNMCGDVTETNRARMIGQGEPLVIVKGLAGTPAATASLKERDSLEPGQISKRPRDSPRANVDKNYPELRTSDKLLPFLVTIDLPSRGLPPLLSFTRPPFHPPARRRSNLIDSLSRSFERASFTRMMSRYELDRVRSSSIICQR